VEEFGARGERDDETTRLVTLIDDGIVAAVPEIQADPLLVDELHRSTRSHWRSFVASLVSPQAPVQLPAPAADLARTLARRGLELGVLLKIYRVGNRYLWQYFIELVDELPDDGPTRDETLVFLWTRGGVWLDESIEQLIQVFYEERERALEGRIARRVEIIEALLGGRSISATRATEMLSHALSHHQTAFVLWIEEPLPEAVSAMQAAAQAVATALGAPRPLTMSGSSRELWCWAATPVVPDVAARLGPAWQEQFRDVHLAVGSPARGVAGFRTSHQEARAVQRLVVSAGRAPGVLRYDEVDLLCLTGGEPDALARVAGKELGGLAADSKSLTQVRETLLVYLTSGSNVEATAERLYVHRNTVRYRLNRAEELIGHSLAERTAHLELALRYVDIFGVPGATGDAGGAGHRQPSTGRRRPSDY
jgi:DNA-binding PucR family transcriptional regulator